MAKIQRAYIIVPSLNATGPVKGAVALANGLSEQVETCFVRLKPQGTLDGLHLRPEVRLIDLASYSLSEKFKVYRKLLGEKQSVSISMCMSADGFNRLFKARVPIIGSVRGNLFQNYRHDYGLKGVAIARTHLEFLRGFNAVTVMSESMEEQLKNMRFQNLSVIPNFLDEGPLLDLRSKARKLRELNKDLPPRFSFVGSLSTRKQPDLLVKIFSRLKKQGLQFHLDLIGDGPLKSEIENLIDIHGMSEMVTLHGHMNEPYELVAKSDYFILPSLSEGTSRALMEALFIGRPCIARKVDGSDEIIHDGVNGFLFDTDDELEILLERLIQTKPLVDTEIVLPSTYRQKPNVDAYWSLAQSLL